MTWALHWWRPFLIRRRRFPHRLPADWLQLPLPHTSSYPDECTVAHPEDCTMQTVQLVNSKFKTNTVKTSIHVIFRAYTVGLSPHNKYTVGLILLLCTNVYSVDNVVLAIECRLHQLIPGRLLFCVKIRGFCWQLQEITLHAFVTIFISRNNYKVVSAYKSGEVVSFEPAI